MRIAFADFTPWDYNLESVYQSPLGGTQSAACYLAEALAQQGHQVYLLTYTTAPGVRRGVHCLGLNNITTDDLARWDLNALVLMAPATLVLNVRKLLPPNTRMVLWTGHAHDQPAVEHLADSTIHSALDGIALVSQWQAHQFIARFRLDPARIGIMRNAAAPAFAHMFKPDESILPHKSQPPVLAYTPTPFRGLSTLLETFPLIRQRIPGTTLRVFSSMKVYHVSEVDDQREYGALYQRCRSTEGVQYIGSLPQPALAQALKGVSVLAYPNDFAETSCICVMEAMAAGCRIVTSDFGALSETTAGFAQLVPIAHVPRTQYVAQFIEQTVQVMCDAAEQPCETETFLRRQVNYANDAFSWTTRAQEWVRWLSGLA